jgi:hypothetical protein
MRLGVLVALTALAAAGRLMLLALPNISLTFLVVAVAGLAYGGRVGAAVGFASMALTSLMLGGPTPSALTGASAVALLGALCGLLRPTGFPGPRRSAAQTVTAAGLGVLLQLAFSLSADAMGWALFAAREAGALPLPWYLAGGLLFNVPAAAFQAALFAGALQPVLRALRAAGLAPERAASRPARVVVIADA